MLEPGPDGGRGTSLMLSSWVPSPQPRGICECWLSRLKVCTACPPFQLALLPLCPPICSCSNLPQALWGFSQLPSWAQGRTVSSRRWPCPGRCRRQSHVQDPFSVFLL